MGPVAEAFAPVEASRHKCLIYEGDPSEQLPVVIPFLLDGLRNDWRCLYLGSPAMVEMVGSALTEHGLDATREVRKGSLILSAERNHLTNGGFEPRAMVDSLSDTTHAAVRDGFRGLYATGDMAWEMGSAANFGRLVEYEALLEEVFQTLPLRGICQYRRDLVPAPAVRHALITHRSTYVGSRLNRDNLFYIPPELLLESDTSVVAKQGQWMCQQILRVLDAEQLRDQALAALQASEAHQRRLSEQLAEMNHDLERRVTERTAELELANKDLKAFSSSVSHDLRAPLQAIIGFGELLAHENSQALGESGRKRVSRVLENAEHMKELIEGLLTLAGVVRAGLKQETIDLSEMAEAVARELRERDSGRAVQLIIQGEMRAVGDRALLRAVLTNLIGNAWKFTSKVAAARIEIGERDPESRAKTFFVKDNGAGFDMSRAEKLFEPFERLHREGEFPGTGIGLATVQRIIAKHAGRIWAQSAPGRGATFWFTLWEEKEADLR